MNKIKDSKISSILLFGIGVALTITTQKLLSYFKTSKTTSKTSNNNKLIKEESLESEKQLLKEQLKRNYEFFGEEEMEKIKNSYVCVVGLGGVGSHAVMTLIRSGVQRIRVIDYDTVTLSSLNRHAFAIREDVGLFKTQVVKEFCKKIFPLTVIEDVDDALTDETKDKYLSGIDYVIDCIDDLNNKCSLLNYCIDKKIPVISSMGAGARLNPFMIRISDLNSINGEPIARRLRQLYKKRYNTSMPNGIKCVFSIEKTTRGLTEMQDHQKENKENYQINENERIRTIPVFASIPAMFGQSLAAVLLCDLSGEKAFDLYNEKEEEEEKKIGMLGEFEIVKLITQFKEEESKRRKIDLKEFDKLDYEDYIEIAKKYNYRSTISKKVSKLIFAIWNPEIGLTKENIVIMMRSEAFNHYKVNNVEELNKTYSEEIRNRIIK